MRPKSGGHAPDLIEHGTEAAAKTAHSFSELGKATVRSYAAKGNCYYAHAIAGAPHHEWHVLEEHLRSVAETASLFAAKFNAGSWGFAAGLWHDLGKYASAFQSYLRCAAASEDYHQAELKENVDHTSAGAQHAVEILGIPGHLLAYAIAGHHAGLLDGFAQGASLDKRLRKRVEPWKHGLARLPVPPPQLDRFLGG